MMELENSCQSTESPLVSIIVVTYNSAKYVLETLESAKKQVYKNIELIVSDDCSTDNTVEICRKWLAENKNRFTHTELITVKKNTGIPANSNRGLFVAHGEWIKLIAGDDILLSDCILQNLKFARNNSGQDFLVSQMYVFESQNGQPIIKSTSPTRQEELKFFELPASKQFEFLLTRSFNFAPATFINISVFEKFGGFNEQYRYIDDLPYWLKITKGGVKLNFIAIPSVLYRISDQSATHIEGKFYNIDFYLCQRQMNVEQIFPYVPFYNLQFWLNKAVEYLKFKTLVNVFDNKKTRYSSIVAKLFDYLNIRYFFKSLKNKILSLFTINF